MKHPAVARLLEGNRRYRSGKSAIDGSESRRIKTPYRRKPFAVVLGCSDSRVPPEIIFDQGLGDLFVVRTVASIPHPSVVAAVEFGVRQFQCPLLVVLGHSRCGGMRPALDHVQGKDAGNFDSSLFIDALRPPAEAAV